MGSSGALGQLLLYLFYGMLLFPGLTLLILSFVFKKRSALIVGCILVLTVLFHMAWRYEGERRSGLIYVGEYLLTDYPNCDSCILILTKDNCYKVLNKKITIETGDWHYDDCCDAFIVYMNNKGDQLGSGKFLYKELRKSDTEQ